MSRVVQSILTYCLVICFSLSPWAWASRTPENLTNRAEPLGPPEVAGALVLDPESGEPQCQVLASQDPHLFPKWIQSSTVENSPIPNIPYCTDQADIHLLKTMADKAKPNVQEANILMGLFVAAQGACLVGAIIGGVLGYFIYREADQTGAFNEFNNEQLANVRAKTFGHSVGGGATSGGGSMAVVSALTHFQINAGVMSTPFLTGVAGATLGGTLCGAMGGSAGGVFYYFQNSFNR